MNIDEIKTIILRYRDLSSKDTIGLHQKIIQKEGFVWWGWWAKPQEKVCTDVFQNLNDIADKETLEVFLLDSGKLELRRAVCTEIVYSAKGDFINSPLKKATPTYYKKNQYMLWSKFTNVSDPIIEANEEINKYSYIRIDEHFANGKSPFSAFDNKVIFNLTELVEQQCTIWYIRRRKEGDRNERIVSYEPGIGNYDKSFSIMKSSKMLWLSDLHFSKYHHAFKRGVGSDNRLANVLMNNLAENNQKNIDRIIVTGDFSYTSSDDEFDEAKVFFHSFASSYGLNPSTYIFCPGNHDMKFSEDAYTEDNAPVKLNFNEAKINYLNFYQAVKGITANDYLNSIHRFITPNGKPVEIISLNTCILQQDKDHFRGMGYVGNDQLNSIQQELKETKKIVPYRVIIMHHHLLPVLYSEMPQINPMYSMLLDSEAVTQFCLRNNISLVLHGHTHKDFFTQIVRPVDENHEQTIRVVGLGSTGVVREHLTEGYNNQYAIVDFAKQKVSIKIYELPTNGSINKEILKEYNIPYGD